jgi:CheY-like chemotaxis protein
MHLLVIEDDPKLSQMLQRLLGGDQHIVELARDASSGIELAQDVPGIEAVILDVGLPDRSGFEVAAELRKRGNRVPILMLTARDTIGDRVAGARRRRGRLPREAVRVCRARRPAEGARPSLEQRAGPRGHDPDQRPDRAR